MSKKKNNKQQQIKPNVASPAELLPSSPSVFEFLPGDCVAQVLSCLPLYNVCSIMLCVCWGWNRIICKYLGLEFIKKWNDPKTTRLGGGMLILRPLCAAVGLLWSMEKNEMKVSDEDIIQLLCVRYETALSMNLEKLAEHDAKEIVRMVPTQITGHMYLGDLYAQKGNHDKARKEYTLAMEADPGNLVVLRKMNDLGVQVRVNRLAEWMTRMSTIKRLIVVSVIVIFIVLFITQALRVF